VRRTREEEFDPEQPKPHSFEWRGSITNGPWNRTEEFLRRGTREGGDGEIDREDARNGNHSGGGSTTASTDSGIRTSKTPIDRATKNGSGEGRKERKLTGRRRQRSSGSNGLMRDREGEEFGLRGRAAVDFALLWFLLAVGVLVFSTLGRGVGRVG
jgi:hypothetical protein